jgi:hypothetical protein
MARKKKKKKKGCLGAALTRNGLDLTRSKFCTPDADSIDSVAHFKPRNHQSSPWTCRFVPCPSKVPGHISVFEADNLPRPANEPQKATDTGLCRSCEDATCSISNSFECTCTGENSEEIFYPQIMYMMEKRLILTSLDVIKLLGTEVA